MTSFEIHRSWTLPPSANLTDVRDLKYIEPMLIALADPAAADDEPAPAATSPKLARAKAKEDVAARV